MGLHLGPTFPLTPLAPTFLPRLEIGFVPSAIGGRLQIFVTGSYASPIARGTTDDSRVPGGSYDWELRQREIALGAGASFDLLPRDAAWHPEVAIAPVLWLLHTSVTGDADSSEFGESTEAYTQAGLLAAAGIGKEIGPGRLILRVEFAMAPLTGQVTGKSSTSAIDPTLGYRMYF